MALQAAGSALVAGNRIQEDSMVQVNVKVLRAFYWQGRALKVGEKVSLPKTFAAEVVASNKAEYVPDTPKAPEVEAKPKGDQHAR